jgi:hypothetical protein
MMFTYFNVTLFLALSMRTVKLRIRINLDRGFKISPLLITKSYSMGVNLGHPPPNGRMVKILLGLDCKWTTWYFFKRY